MYSITLTDPELRFPRHGYIHRNTRAHTEAAEMTATVWLLIGLWRLWGFMADLSRLESRGSYFYPCSTPSYHNSCPHSSCQSAVRNSRPIRVLLLLLGSGLSLSALHTDLLHFDQLLIRSVTCGNYFDTEAVELLH